jgi:hypothetical protein
VFIRRFEYFYIWSLCICIFYTVGQNDVPEEDILKHIFNKYNHQARPGTRNAPTVVVDHTLSLLRIADLVSITYI